MTPLFLILKSFPLYTTLQLNDSYLRNIRVTTFLCSKHKNQRDNHASTVSTLLCNRYIPAKRTQFYSFAPENRHFIQNDKIPNSIINFKFHNIKYSTQPINEPLKQSIPKFLQNCPTNNILDIPQKIPNI